MKNVGTQLASALLAAAYNKAKVKKPMKGALRPRRVSKTKKVVTAQQPRKYEDTNQYRQRETVVDKKVQRLTRYQFNNRLLSGSYSFTKYLYRAYREEDAGGALTTALFNSIGQQPATGGNLFMPVYAYNLSVRPQQIAGVLQSAPVAWRMYTPTATSSSVAWSAQPGLLNNGSPDPSATFQAYNTYTSATGDARYPTCRKSMLEYINLKYTLCGPRNRWTRFTVQIVQPEAWFTSMPGGQDSGPTYNSVWRELVNRITCNQCQSIPKTNARKPWKVLMTKTYTIQPTSSTESDVGGHEVHQKYFWKCNRVLDYSWNQVDVASGLTDLDIGTQDRALSVDSTCKNEQSLWLLVYAHAPTRDAVDTVNTAITPSFDISIEAKHSWIDGKSN